MPPTRLSSRSSSFRLSWTASLSKPAAAKYSQAEAAPSSTRSKFQERRRRWDLTLQCFTSQKGSHPLIRFRLASLAICALLILVQVPALTAQAASVTPVQASGVEANRKALNAVFEDYWQDNLKHSPEFASTIGDKRYNDQISDYSVKAFNEGLAREQSFLLRLAAIEPAGLTNQERISRELLLRQFAEDAEAADFKEWEMPLNQMGGIHTIYPRLVAQLSFTTVKDYDDWIARLHAIPRAFDQVAANMSVGMDDGRVPPKYLLAKVLDQVKGLASQNPEEDRKS